MNRQPLWKVSVTTTPEAEDAVAESLSAILNQPATVYFDLESGASTVTVYLPRKTNLSRKGREDILAGLKRIKGCGLRISPGKVMLTKVRSQDWAESWKRHFKPIEIGEALLIKPSWSERKARKGQAVMVLDPGLSFGTGQHPTTSFCLHQIVAVACGRRSRRSQGGALNNFVEDRAKSGSSRNVASVLANHSRLRPPSFLDLGTGSGILAIAAAKLGFSPVHALDFDPEAVRVARANARANQVLSEVKIRHSDVSKLPIRPGQRRHRYDLVCANLLTDLLIAQRRRIAAQLEPDGTLVLAGILRSEFGSVQKAYKTLGLGLVSRRMEKEWGSGSFRFGG